MRITVFLNGLGLGGTEKAACRWARGLVDRGHHVTVLALADGPRRSQLESDGIDTSIVAATRVAVADALRAQRPDVIHAHVPGNSHMGEVLGEALSGMPKIPVIQTNIFGRLENPREDQWTDYRLFISWTSCVQAARRAGVRLTSEFFERSSVAAYPLDPRDFPDALAIQEFRHANRVADDEVLFGRLSRPEPNKWTDLPVRAFRMARRRQPRVKLLLREPPPEVARGLAASPDRDAFVVLPATGNAQELDLTMASLDVVLHTSSIGESFGYGIAEPMNLGKPVIANSTPSGDQAQIELIRPGECGLLASTCRSISKAMIRLAMEPPLRERLGLQGREHIRRLANPEESLNRLESALRCAVDGRGNPSALADCERAREVAEYLDQHQFSGGIDDAVLLRGRYLMDRFFRAKQRLACRISPIIGLSRIQGRSVKG